MSHGTVLALLVAVVLTGCGTTPLSTSQLRRQATRVCSVADAQTGRIPAPAGPAGEAGFLAAGLSILRAEQSALSGLHPPAELASAYRRSLDAFAQKLRALNHTIRDLRKGTDPVAAIKALQRHLAPIEAKENRAWDALQIPACVNR